MTLLFYNMYKLYNHLKAKLYFEILLQAHLIPIQLVKEFHKAYIKCHFISKSQREPMPQLHCHNHGLIVSQVYSKLTLTVCMDSLGNGLWIAFMLCGVQLSYFSRSFHDHPRSNIKPLQTKLHFIQVKHIVSTRIYKPHELEHKSIALLPRVPLFELLIWLPGYRLDTAQENQYNSR